MTRCKTGKYGVLALGGAGAIQAARFQGGIGFMEAGWTSWRISALDHAADRYIGSRGRSGY